MKNDKNKKYNERNNETDSKTAKDGTKRGLNKNSQKNLKPIKPGEVKNDKGRGKGILNYKTRITIAIDAITSDYVKFYNSTHKRKKLTAEEVDILGDVFKQALNKARNGDPRMIIDLFDRLYGKATQTVELTGKNGNPIEHKLKVEEARKELLKNQDKWFKKK